MGNERPDPRVLDDVDVVESIRYFQQDRSRKRLVVVLGLAAAIGVGCSAVYLSYSDQLDTVREIEATQPASR